ncbi:MAG TPA: hypothetical protein VKA31_11245 [Mariprofundaceae bacterium]|nr:hypothetical protein [Mariprofundaceae bacterium]
MPPDTCVFLDAAAGEPAKSVDAPHPVELERRNIPPAITPMSFIISASACASSLMAARQHAKTDAIRLIYITGASFFPNKETFPVLWILVAPQAVYIHLNR